MNREAFLRYAARFPEALMLVAGDGRIVAGNDALAELLGRPVTDLERQTLFDWAPEAPERVRAALRLWSGTGRMIYGPAPFRCGVADLLRCEGALLAPAEGGERALIVRVRRQEAAAERFLGLNRKIAELHQEIRARRQAENEIREQREWLRVTPASIGDAVIATDVRGNIEFINPVAERLTGWTMAEAVGRPMAELFDIFNEHTRAVVENPVERVLREGVIVGLANHTILRARDGTERPIEDSAAPIRRADGELIGAVLVFHDVTEQHAARAEVVRARDEAVAASRAKDDFLAALSHELRTPLNPILLLASEAAANERLAPEVRGDFETIAKNATIEARLIDDLLDLTRIVRGKLSLEPRTVDVHAVLGEAVDGLRPELEAKRLAVEVALEAEVAAVSADAARLQQVFWNVLKNAVKFTPDGGRVQVRTANTPSGREVAIEFADSGRGLTAVELERAFEAFFQGGEAAAGSHRAAGLGLGLAISRTLVELHGGRISAASEGRGHGAVFTVVLPTLAAGAAAVAGGAAGEVRGAQAGPTRRRLLLIEDHQATRAALARLLGKRGYDVVACESVAEAVAAAERQRFDLVVSDIGLPDGNGHDLMRRLRERHGLRGIAVTGYGMERDVEASREAGFVAHLTKPVNMATLDLALREVEESGG